MSGRSQPRAENDAEVAAALRALLVEYGGKQYLMAEALGVSGFWLSQVLNGLRSPSRQMAEMVGYRRVSRWVRIEEKAK